MADFTVRSDSVDVDQIMKQIRTRIREKRGVDYTEADLQHLASIKMEQFLDPRKLRSDLVEQFKRQRAASPAAPQEPGAPPPETGNVFKRLARRFVKRVVRSAVNPQDTLDVLNAEFRRREELYYEILHNLVLEMTRLGIEAHNLRMHVESLSSRLDFDERRGRALETVVQYRPMDTPGQPVLPDAGALSPAPDAPGRLSPPAPLGARAASGTPGGLERPDGQRRRRRRRRRRRPGQTMGDRSGAPGLPGAPAAAAGPGPSGTPDSPFDQGGDFDHGGDAGEGDGADDQ
jgi:hypothetical protein